MERIGWDLVLVFERGVEQRDVSVGKFVCRGLGTRLELES